MKKIIIVLSLVLIFYSISFAKNYDTTFTANLVESKKSTVKISFEYDESGQYFNGVFTLNIDGIILKDSCTDAYDGLEATVVNLDKKDEYQEIAIVTYFSINMSYQMYRFNGKHITPLGDVYSNDKPVFVGNGVVKATGWMGFWSYDFEFMLNKDKMKYEPIYKDEYPVKFYEGFEGEIVVLESFSIFTDRDKKSSVVTKFKKGDKIKILRAYIKVKCEEDESNESCFWYLIQDKEGKKGWLQLRDFQEKVEGLPWAG
jgi:hypothetical protein